MGSMMNIGQDWKKIEVGVSLKEGKYPFFSDMDLEVIEQGRYTSREVGRPIYISGRLISNGKVIFERINQIAAKLNNAQILRTEKGTLVLKHVPGAVLYIIEIPSGFRGGVYANVEGECVETTILRSPRGSIGEVIHIWINGGECKVKYKITGRTYTAGYEFIPRLFGGTMEGEIVLQDGNVSINYDSELERILEV